MKSSEISFIERSVHSVLEPIGFAKREPLRWERTNRYTEVILLSVECARRSEGASAIVASAGFVDPIIDCLFFESEMVPYRDFDYGTNLQTLRRSCGLSPVDFAFDSPEERERVLLALCKDVSELLVPFLDEFSDQRKVWLELVRSRASGQESVLRNASLPENWVFEALYGDAELALARVKSALKSVSRWDSVIGLFAVGGNRLARPTARKLRRIQDFISTKLASRNNGHNTGTSTK